MILFNSVDIDEKWFELYSFNHERYQENSSRKKVPVLSKANIPKIMSITAVIKPNSENNEAQRSSKNHTKCDVYKFDCTMTSAILCKLMSDKIMPAISNKMHWCKNIFIQMDNARPHVGKTNVQRLNDFGDSLIPTVTVMNQPAQSPELNITDIGLFHSLNKRCQKFMCNDLDALWSVLQTEFWSTKEKILTSLFSTKSRIINVIIVSRGEAVNLKYK